MFGSFRYFSIDEPVITNKISFFFFEGTFRNTGYSPSLRHAVFSLLPIPPNTCNTTYLNYRYPKKFPVSQTTPYILKLNDWKNWQNFKCSWLLRCFFSRKKRFNKKWKVKHCFWSHFWRWNFFLFRQNWKLTGAIKCCFSQAKSFGIFSVV